MDFNSLKKEIEERDYNDSHRDFAPLVQAKDAIFIDTSNMDIDGVINAVMSHIKK